MRGRAGSLWRQRVAIWGIGRLLAWGFEGGYRSIAGLQAMLEAVRQYREEKGKEG